VTDADIEVALKMEEKGSEVPDSLKPALEKYKKDNPDKFPAGDEPDGDDPATPEDPSKDSPESKPEAKPDESKPTDPGTDSDEDDDAGDDEGDEEDDDDAGEDPVGSKKKRRPVRYIPIKEYKDQKKNWATREGTLVTEVDGLKKKIEELSGSKADDDKKTFEENLEQVANETGFAKGDLQKILDLIEKKVALPADLVERLKKQSESPAPESTPAAPAKSQAEQEKEMIEAQVTEFENEFTTALAEPGADPEMAKHKKAIQRLAFTKGFTTKSVWELYTRFVKPKADKAKKGIDTPGSQPGSGSGESADFASLAADPVKQREFLRSASMDEKEKFTEYMGRQNAGNRVRRAGKPIN